MRTFEVRIDKNAVDVKDGVETTFTWPDWWMDVVESVIVEAYEETETKGRKTEGCVCICEDEVWDYIEAKNDPKIKVLNEASANAKGRKWRPQVIKIHDPESVLAACAKSAIGRALTAEEKKSLDPDDSTKGVGKTKKFDVRELCSEHGGSLNGG